MKVLRQVLAKLGSLPLNYHHLPVCALSETTVPYSYTMADSSGPAETRLELCTCESECGPSGRMIPAYEIRNHRRRDDRRQTTTFRRARGLRVASAKVLGTGRGVMNTTAARVAPTSRAPLRGGVPSVALERILGERSETTSENKRNRTTSISATDPPEAQRMRMSVTPEPHEQSAGSSRDGLETRDSDKVSLCVCWLSYS
ncbi:hypothetical protein OH77DRAFT_159408 [Trametes cingulata]|nr:hypothetical protein OH77DRAFT_159408 [Trametes cingulata]